MKTKEKTQSDAILTSEAPVNIKAQFSQKHGPVEKLRQAMQGSPPARMLFFTLAIEWAGGILRMF